MTNTTYDRKKLTADELRAYALTIRRQSVEMTRSASSAHIGGCLSAADLLAVLYGSILRIDSEKPDDPARDRFILSKGHAAAALYAALAARGFAAVDQLATFYKDGSKLVGHATRGAMPGVEVSTGSLGHGLPIATGMALAGRTDGAAYRVFCLLSDGECDEGSTWEAAMLASHLGLENLVAIVDYNKIQSLGFVSEVVRLEPFTTKWDAAGWSVTEIDGHDVTAIEQALSGLPARAGKPTCIMAHTVKGKGVSFMENKLLWHYRSPQGEEYQRAVAELEGHSR